MFDVDPARGEFVFIVSKGGLSEVVSQGLSVRDCHGCHDIGIIIM